MSDDSIVPFTGISCAAGGINSGTQYLRRFFLTADHGITDPFSVTDAKFGVETETPGTNGQPPMPPMLLSN